MKRRTDIGYTVSNIYHSFLVQTELNLMRLEKQLVRYEKQYQISNLLGKNRFFFIMVSKICEKKKINEDLKIENQVILPVYNYVRNLIPKNAKFKLISYPFSALSRPPLFHRHMV